MKHTKNTKFEKSKAGRLLHALAFRPELSWATKLRDPLTLLLDKLARDLDVPTPVPSQLRQELFVLAVTRGKQNGFFVEFGATNGLTLSNSYVLQKQFGWNGILAEPSPEWHDALWENRNCAIDTRCVWRASGDKLKFVPSGELSTLSQFTETEIFKALGTETNEVIVETVSLKDLLDTHKAPEHIDFLSIDTEGSELEILTAYDFSDRKIDIIACEHAYSEDREKIADLLGKQGYRVVWPVMSRWDDWFVHERVEKY